MAASTHRVLPIASLAFIAALVAAMPAAAGQPGKSPVKVFRLAGQSNMEGQAVVDLDHEKYYNGGRGTLKHLMMDPAKAPLFKHLKDAAGKCTEGSSLGGSVDM